MSTDPQIDESIVQGDQVIEPKPAVVIIVGAHPRAEMEHRPLAYRLAERITKQTGVRHIVCTDLWYLNDAQMQAKTAIAIGEPEVNAATAFLSSRLPTAFVVEDVLRIHVDPEFIEAKACVWGVDAAATGTAIDVFVERYLSEFVEGGSGE